VPVLPRRGEGLRALRAAYPHKVALLFRNYPLPYHVHAYSAARMAECAADQRRFTKAHDVLFRADLATLKASALAHAVKVPDSVRFVACSSRKDSVASIRRDIKAADELGVDGVPAVIVQGTMFRMPPDSAKLFTLVQKLIKTSPNE
jgi:protein-disulfide isomerase